MSICYDSLIRLYATSDLDRLTEAADATGHIPDPWQDYLEWVLVHEFASPAGVELRRLIGEVLG